MFLDRPVARLCLLATYHCKIVMKVDWERVSEAGRGGPENGYVRHPS